MANFTAIRAGTGGRVPTSFDAGVHFSWGCRGAESVRIRNVWNSCVMIVGILFLAI